METAAAQIARTTWKDQSARRRRRAEHCAKLRARCCRRSESKASTKSAMAAVVLRRSCTRAPEYRHSRLGNAEPQWARIRREPLRSPGKFHCPMYRSSCSPAIASARGCRSHAAGRQRVPAQAGFDDRAPGARRVDPVQAAPDDETRRSLRSGTAHSSKLQAGNRPGFGQFVLLDEIVTPPCPRIARKNRSRLIVQSLCVLVVDDNQIYAARSFRNLLINAESRISTKATDGIAALDSIRTVAPDAVILDWEMPAAQRARTVADRALAGRIPRCPMCRLSCSRPLRALAGGRGQCGSGSTNS